MQLYKNIILLNSYSTQVYTLCIQIEYSSATTTWYTPSTMETSSFESNYILF
jgi:hypothetical protein